MAKTTSFCENTRVQVPAALHLVKLGYSYLSHIAPNDYDHYTNILLPVLRQQLAALNPSITPGEIESTISDLLRMAKNEDLGREFYERITSISGIKIIDFQHPERNVWHCTTEFTCHNDNTGDEFRPDITCFVNGIPVVFIEVKKPENRQGCLAERDRIDTRASNKSYRTFFNTTQFMIFSNNMEYEEENRVPVSGAFYATPSLKKHFFNVFREEDSDLLSTCGYNPNIDDEVEKQVLVHRNCVVIKHDPAYLTNKQPTTPTNRLLTSMLSRERLLFILRYGIAYVNQEVELPDGSKVIDHQKHIMRYQQLFATLAIRRKMDEGVRGGIIWHTQGSGKTALAYYNVKSLTDYFAQRNTITKFYFIVDRLDLMEQAMSEFRARGLSVRTAQSRDELMRDFDPDNFTIAENREGRPEIMVVNIQKFKDDHKKIELKYSYSVNLQRVFFVDEAHRGYDPQGSFLAMLLNCDTKAIRLALTGTPLLANERASWKVFGNYIHKYYYDKSIADGYTLRLMREDVETTYKHKISDILEQLKAVEVKSSDFKRETIIEHDRYLNALLDYIIEDMRVSRVWNNCPGMGGMIVCETNAQARNLYRLFNERFSAANLAPGQKPMRAILILHDEDSKEDRKLNITEFKKKETIDVVIVNDMLLTGFDAPRLKKLYLLKSLQMHGLLQALCRVNRPYKDFKFGYVVDFADIQSNFSDANNRYIQELNRVGDEMAAEGEQGDISTSIGQMLMPSPDEIKTKILRFKNEVWKYNTSNMELYRQQLTEVESLDDLYHLREVLEDVKALSNVVRSFGDDDAKAKMAELPTDRIATMITVLNARIQYVRSLGDISHSEDVEGIIRLALEQMEYEFKKVSEGELKMVYDDLREAFAKTSEEFDRNFDKQGPDFINLFSAFRQYLADKGMVAQDEAEAQKQIGYMTDVMKKIQEVNHRNNLLKQKYDDDERFTRIHKRIMETNSARQQSEPKQRPIISDKEYEVAEALGSIRKGVNDMVYANANLLENENYFNSDVMARLSNLLNELNMKVSIDDRKIIRNLITNEVITQYRNIVY